MKRYDATVAVVTGASSGIGRRIAVDLTARGATVIGLARREALLKDLRDDLQRVSPQSDTIVSEDTLTTMPLPRVSIPGTTASVLATAAK